MLHQLARVRSVSPPWRCSSRRQCSCGIFLGIGDEGVFISLVYFGDGGKFAKVGGGFSGVDEGGVNGDGGDVLRFAEAVASENAVELEGVKGTPGVRWGGGAAWTDDGHAVQMHLGNVEWGD